MRVARDTILAGDWQLDDSVGYVPNDMFGMDGLFYPPISARLGMRYSF